MRRSEWVSLLRELLAAILLLLVLLAVFGRPAALWR